MNENQKKEHMVVKDINAQVNEEEGGSQTDFLIDEIASRIIPEHLKEKLRQLPELPGVYLMKDKDGKVIYVGKAAFLKNRVRSYFQSPHRLDPKTAALVEKITDLETIVVSNPREALILENTLIKRYVPRYNIRLKDDKQYPFLQLTVNEPFPRLLVARHARDDKTRYFGPYAGTGSIWEMHKIIKQLFPLRSCNKKNWPQNHRACLNAHLGQCMAPCEGKISEEEYQKIVKDVILFLDGKTAQIKRKTERAMEEASKELRFEEAARLRDLLNVLDEVREKQLLDKSGHGGNYDVLAAAAADEQAVIQVFFVRGGKVTGRDHFFLSKSLPEEKKSIIAHFLLDYYGGGDNIPSQLYLSKLPDELIELEGVLSEKASHNVKLIEPQRGEKKRLLKLVEMNAELVLSQKQKSSEQKEREAAGALEELRQTLGLENTPSRMECYDISHIQGSYTVGSMVVFINGLSKPKYYRHFKIKTVDGVDDFASLKEVLTRRFKRGIAEREEGKTPLDFGNFPDLLVIDGGKGQLSSVINALQGIGVDKIPIISLAKEEEEIFTPGKSESLRLDRDSAALKLLERIRDESHRFAITFHRELRKKGQTESLLGPGYLVSGTKGGRSFYKPLAH